MQNTLKDQGGPGDTRIGFLLYLIAWSNIFAVSLYLTKLPTVWLDRWLCLYPLLKGAYLGLQIWLHGGPKKHFKSQEEPFDFYLQLLNAAVVGLGLLGVFFFILREIQDGTVLGERYERLFLASTSLLVLTLSPYFAKALNALYLSILATMPFGGTMVCIMLIFSEMLQDLYKDNPRIPEGYFSDFGKSFQLVFWIFLGENWNGVMWDVQQATHHGTTVLFIVYTFASTLLFAQLVLGVIIAVYSDIAGFLSPRLYIILKPLYSELSEAEKHRLMQNFLKINYLLKPIHEKIEELTALDTQKDMRWVNTWPSAAEPSVAETMATSMRDLGICAMPADATERAACFPLCGEVVREVTCGPSRTFSACLTVSAANGDQQPPPLHRVESLRMEAIARNTV